MPKLTVPESGIEVLSSGSGLTRGPRRLDECDILVDERLWVVREDIIIAAVAAAVTTPRKQIELVMPQSS
jgi:hypothetical protein